MAVSSPGCDMKAPAISVTLTEMGHIRTMVYMGQKLNLKFPGIKYEEVCLFKIKKGMWKDFKMKCFHREN